MTKALEHADAIMAAKGGTMLMAVEPVNVTDISENRVLTLPIGRMVRVECSTGFSMFARDAETLKSIAFGMETSLSFEIVKGQTAAIRAGKGWRRKTIDIHTNPE